MMYKKSASIFTIVFKSFKAFFDRLPQFLLFILYPVFGQLAGVLIIFTPFLIASSAKSVYLPLLGITLPLGLIIFCHSFWRYLLVSGALVLIGKQIVENGPVKDFNYYLDVFKKRSGEYITFLLITAFVIPLLFVLAIILIGAAFIAIGYLDIQISMHKVSIAMAACGILAGLISLVFYSVPLQAFALNQNLTPMESILKGARLTLRNYFPNLGLIIMIAVVTSLYGVLISFLISSFIFTPSMYQAHIEFKNIMYLISSTTSYCFGGILLPFSIIAMTWWYLRMEKEHNSRAKQR